MRPEQVEAAQAIYSKYTPSWRRVDDALSALATSVPDFRAPAVLIKAAAVDKLYGTYVHCIDVVALRISEVLDDADQASA